MIRAIRQRVPISSSVLIRLGVLAGLVVGLMGIGFLTSRIPPELVLIAIAVPPVVLLALSRLEFGVLAIVLTAAFVRFSLPTGTQSRIVASLLLTVIFTAVWLTRMLVVDKKLQLKPSRVNMPLLGFVLVTFISYVWGNAFRDPLVIVWPSWPFVQIGALAVMVLLPGAFLLASNCLTDLKWIKWLTAIIMAVGILEILGDYLHLPLGFLQVRPMFPTWFICLAYAQALFNRRIPMALRLLLLAFVGAWIYRVVFTQITWLSAWLPTVLAAGAITLWRSRWLMVILLVVALVYVGTNLDDVQAAYTRESAESGVTRLNAYAHNWRVTGKHFLFGVGPAGYAAYYMSYFPGEAMATHSNYLDVLSQTGVVGLLALLGFLLALALVAWDLLRQTRGRFDFPQAFGVGASAGLLGVIVAAGLGDWLLPFVYTQTIAGFDYAVYSWVLRGAMVSLHRLVTPAATDRIRRSE
ncbi:MAG: O-antigen ligase domain-containing protein, partial [Anaerolineales bacterium]